MSQELKEPRQAGDPAGLASNAALTDKSTGIPTVKLDLTQPERLDPAQPLGELAHAARARRRETTAIEARAWQAATEKCRDYAQDAPPSVFNRLDELGPEAMREVSRTMAVGERLGYQAGFEAASALLEVTRAAAYAAGQADLATALHAEHLKWLDAENRALSASLSRGVPYPELCERWGEPDRAERARQALQERGLA